MLAMAAGAALMLAASGRVWVTGLLGAPGPTAPVPVEITGGDLTGALSGLGWAGLAGIAGLYAARSWPRRVVGGLVAACGVFALSALWSATRPDTLTGAVAGLTGETAGTGEVVGTPDIHVLGPLMGAAGAVLLVLSGVAAVVRAPAWPGMGNRYDRDAAPRPHQAETPADLWKSLDAGDDPTLDVPGDGTPAPVARADRAEPGDGSEPAPPADRPAEPKENH
ncbi:Trp biosynthesis-associated membrane protein [Nocardiopsis sp. MG754419]|uniref:Trp biosynthesis-associated membrane protein n=1 Tax=Nocardiopsis sp. MG754419 TaxID=2259865 RepID=UPI001BA538BB|nr:Trp biosynthesis-associated membrane protein [Nocardiopsis sp. MG754419]MBR8741529.1 Trp biosynthesis protein [Nocardiopsis sp. MG754419]